ncbi:HesA/MoeB/ThiF family protein [Halorientalis salina]|uniref:HesA/MoeB/ThiF family protein n=1 Tax=Halorientalis salina TaxID=2932266 RepID=UPI0010AC834B|nr:ThiF family adenylyltransferase [Halorientalis salina]
MLEDIKNADERAAPASTDWIDESLSGVDAVADRVSLRITGDDYESLRDHLIRPDKLEYAAYLLAGTNRYMDGDDEVLEYFVREVVPIRPFRYSKQAKGFVGIPHDVTREMTDDAAGDGIGDDWTVFVVHSHPWSTSPRHSATDDRAEPEQLATIQADRKGPHGSLIIGSDQDSVTGRVWPTDAATIRDCGAAAATPLDEIVILGKRSFSKIRPTDSRIESDDSSPDRDEMRDRQALLHDTEGNRDLGNTDVTVVGAGGLGSDVIHTLAKIGFGRDDGSITVVDPDVVEESNRSRITGAKPIDAGDEDATPDEDSVVPARWTDEIPDLGTAKVDVMERHVTEMDPRITVETVREVGQSKAGMDAITTADIVVTAVDRQTPRRVISRACKQYLRPHIDTGVAINTDGTTSIASRMTVSGAGRPCLDCLGAINEDRLQAEQHGSDQEAYGVGEQPAVATVNAEAAQRASFAAHRYCTGLFDDRGGFATGIFDFATGERYDTNDRNSDCPYCGEDALFPARGERAPSPVKDIERSRPAQPENSAKVQSGEKGVIATLRSLVRTL